MATPNLENVQRGLPRNVFVYDANVPKDQTLSLISCSFDERLEEHFIFCLRFYLTLLNSAYITASDRTILSCDNTTVPIGNYFVVSLGSFPYLPSIIFLADPIMYILLYSTLSLLDLEQYPSTGAVPH